jgi:quercetin 2,3-dioxygenase
VTNTELNPAEIVCRSSGSPEGAGVEVLEPRDVPLGGPRAMTVRRTLPTKQRSLIGAWCFADHYGPQDVSQTGGMNVPPHPHTGLQTVSWLFAGEIEHRDSLGSHQLVRPGDMNLMTAGRGIAHAEVSTATTTRLHGVQLWVALPEAARNTAPAFENVVPGTAADDDVTVSVFLGSWLGQESAAATFSPLVGAELTLSPGAAVTLPIEPAYEHGLLVDSGELLVGGMRVPPARLAYLPPGRTSLELSAGAMGPARALLFGGEPLGEQIVMWWNFVGRSHDEIVAFRDQWQAEIADAAGGVVGARFGPVPGFDGAALPAPVLPGVRLRPRGAGAGA